MNLWFWLVSPRPVASVPVAPVAFQHKLFLSRTQQANKSLWLLTTVLWYGKPYRTNSSPKMTKLFCLGELLKNFTVLSVENLLLIFHFNTYGLFIQKMVSTAAILSLILNSYFFPIFSKCLMPSLVAHVKDLHNFSVRYIILSWVLCHFRLFCLNGQGC